ncbi:DUF4286 family protein [Bacteroidota bacterium]
MIIYNVTVNINPKVHDQWIAWMKEMHIPEVMATGLFIENRFAKVLVEDQGGITYSTQYLCATMEDLNAYKQYHATRIEGLHAKKFEGEFVAFRTLLETVA